MANLGKKKRIPISKRTVPRKISRTVRKWTEIILKSRNLVGPMKNCKLKPTPARRTPVIKDYFQDCAHR